HHFFFRYLHTLQLAAMRRPLETIREWQAKDPALLYRIGEICHRLFPIGGADQLPDEILSAIDQINRVVVAAPVEKLKEARKVLLVAGGAQKMPVLGPLVTGQCPQAPIDPENVILVTDSWTAQQICAGSRL